jgi:hypothetical protein
MMKGSEDILKRKSVNSGDGVVLVFIAETGFSQPRIDFVRCGIRMRDASDAPGRADDRIDALKKFYDNDTCLAAART